MTENGVDQVAFLAGALSRPSTAEINNKRALYERKRSHWVVYSTMFIMSIGFSIVLSGVWPYIQSVNNDLTKDSLGWVVAANPLGQALASPIMGWWGVKAGSARIPLMATVFVFIIGNMMYSLLDIWTGVHKMAPYYVMIFSRFIVGISSANVALCRSYIAESTTRQERTVGISLIAGAQAMGFVIGPGIQAVLVALVPAESEVLLGGWFRWSMYTSAGWVAACLGVINFFLLSPGVFTEYVITSKEELSRKSAHNRAIRNGIDVKNDKLPKPDMLGVVGILLAFFFSMFIFVLIETLAVPFVTDQYGWRNSDAVSRVGYALMAGGALSIVMFILTAVLARKIDERKLLIIVGYIPMVIGCFFFLPWGSVSIPLRHCESDEIFSVQNNSNISYEDYNEVGEIGSVLLNNTWSNDTSVVLGETCTGCPMDEQPWCGYTPQLHMAQLIFASTTVIIGYPVAQSLCQALYSKIVGPRPQGLWMGFLTGVGSSSRVLGPIFVSYIYTNLGTRGIFGILAAIMTITMLQLVILYRRLVPLSVPGVGDNYRLNQVST